MNLAKLAMDASRRKQGQRARKNNKRVRRGTILAPPISIEAKFRVSIQRLVRQMHRETIEAVRQLYAHPAVTEVMAMDGAKRDAKAEAKALIDTLNAKFANLFDSHALNLSSGLAAKVSKVSDKALKGSLKEASAGLTIKNVDIDKGTHKIIEESVDESVDLIKTIPKKYMAYVKEEVNNSLTKSKGIGALIKSLDDIKGVSERRAAMIARDQTRKTYSDMNIKRSSNAGVKKGEWVHSGGSDAPRETHIEFDGQTFDLDKGLYDADAWGKGVGAWVLPAELPNCRCTFIPVIDLDEEE